MRKGKDFLNQRKLMKSEIKSLSAKRIGVHCLLPLLANTIVDDDKDKEYDFAYNIDSNCRKKATNIKRKICLHIKRACQELYEE